MAEEKKVKEEKKDIDQLLADAQGGLSFLRRAKLQCFRSTWTKQLLTPKAIMLSA